MAEDTWPLILWTKDNYHPDSTKMEVCLEERRSPSLAPECFISQRTTAHFIEKNTLYIMQSVHVNADIYIADSHTHSGCSQPLSLWTSRCHRDTKQCRKSQKLMLGDRNKHSINTDCETTDPHTARRPGGTLEVWAQKKVLINQNSWCQKGWFWFRLGLWFWLLIMTWLRIVPTDTQTSVLQKQEVPHSWPAHTQKNMGGG